MTATISNHLPQFATISNMFGNISGNKPNIHERDWFKFDRQDLLKIDEVNADNSTKLYLDQINMLLDTYPPLKRINQYKLKLSLNLG